MAIVPLRVREGDDASCLNLSRAQNPRLVGVQPAEFVKRKAFEFGGTLPPEGAAPKVAFEVRGRPCARLVSA